MSSTPKSSAPTKSAIAKQIVVSVTPAPVPNAPLFLQIANTGGNPVCLSATAFQPTVGKVAYQNITLPAGEPVLGDPTAAIRKTAFPPQK
jgi:hypothetical protein